MICGSCVPRERVVVSYILLNGSRDLSLTLLPGRTERRA